MSDNPFLQGLKCCGGDAMDAPIIPRNHQNQIFRLYFPGDPCPLPVSRSAQHSAQCMVELLAHSSDFNRDSALSLFGPEVARAVEQCSLHYAQQKGALQ